MIQSGAMKNSKDSRFPTFGVSLYVLCCANFRMNSIRFAFHLLFRLIWFEIVAVGSWPSSSLNEAHLRKSNQIKWYFTYSFVRFNSIQLQDHSLAFAINQPVEFYFISNRNEVTLNWCALSFDLIYRAHPWTHFFYASMLKRLVPSFHFKVLTQTSMILMMFRCRKPFSQLHLLLNHFLDAKRAQYTNWIATTVWVGKDTLDRHFM